VRKFAYAIALLVAAGDVGAAAARVDFVYGTVTVAGLDSREQPLLRGAELDNGDTVRTGEGRAQLRFSDGAYVSLQPNSEFAIRDYRFDGKTDGAERGFFGLAKGAMRTVSGLVGRVNRDRYQITTPTATIGIRGTGGVIQVRDDGSTLVVGTSGIWSLTNAVGSIDVPAGVSALAPAAPDSPPQRTSQAPQAGPMPLILPVAYVQGDQRDANGDLTSVTTASVATPPQPQPPLLPPVSGQGTMFAYGQGPDGLSLVLDGPAADVIAQFTTSGQLARAEVGSLVYSLAPGGVHADFGSDGILTWGRWTGPVMLPSGLQNYSPNQGFHYVVGVPTAVLPTNIVNATYVLSGASSPTYLDGSQSPGTFSGSLTVTFAAQATIDTVGWTVKMPDKVFTISDTRISTQSSLFSTAQVPTTGCANAGCTTDISGFFAGPTAERAGVGYSIQDSKPVIGTAAFRRQ
jgi:hypothetical protein